MTKFVQILLTAIALVFVVALIVFLVLENRAPNPLPTPSPTDGSSSQTQTRNIKLFYYNPQQDMDAEGNLQCSRQGLVAVDRAMPITNTPIQDAVRLLMQGRIRSDEAARGVTTEYPLEQVALKGANLNSGVLALEFTDPLGKTSGGACRAGILWSQIEATAKQFPEVQSVRFVPDVLFQP